MSCSVLLAKHSVCVCMCAFPRLSVEGCGALVQRVPSGAAGPSTCPGQTALTAPLERLVSCANQ